MKRIALTAAAVALAAGAFVVRSDGSNGAGILVAEQRRETASEPALPGIFRWRVHEAILRSRFSTSLAR